MAMKKWGVERLRRHEQFFSGSTSIAVFHLKINDVLRESVRFHHPEGKSVEMDAGEIVRSTQIPLRVVKSHDNSRNH